MLYHLQSEFTLHLETKWSTGQYPDVHFKCMLSSHSQQYITSCATIVKQIYTYGGTYISLCVMFKRHFKSQMDRYGFEVAVV